MNGTSGVDKAPVVCRLLIGHVAGIADAQKVECAVLRKLDSTWEFDGVPAKQLRMVQAAPDRACQFQKQLRRHIPAV